MTIVTLVRAEFSRLTSSGLARIALAALLLVPVLYGGLYLWANDDPYAGLDRVPAALVIADSGTTVDGEPVNYAADVARDIVSDGTFEWHRVSASTADAGVDDGRFDFAVTLPEGFSAALASADGSDPRRGSIELLTSDTNGALSSTIATQATAKIRDSIAQTVGERAADAFLVGFSTIREDLVAAVDGAGTLADGAAAAADGATALESATGQLRTGAQALAGGLGTLESGASALPGQTADLATGANGIAAGSARLTRAADQAATDSQQAADTVPGMRASVQARLEQAGLAPDEITGILAQLDPLSASVSGSNARLQAIDGQLRTLTSGATQVAAGTDQLAAAAPRLAAGVSTAATAAGSLATGTDSIATGTSELSSGLVSLRGGAADLRDGLSGGVDRIPASDDASRSLEAATIADPVAVAAGSLTEAGGYGAGLAPFFVSLAAWIGIYALFLIVKPLSRRALTGLRAPVRVALAGWLTPALLGVMQMAGLFGVVAGLLGFRIDQPASTFAFMALTSVAFAAILLALNVWLGSVGQFVGLVLMIVQLVTAGGTFPWQTLPGPLAALHHALPMSSAVDGLRQLMYGGSAATAAGDAVVLACWLGGGLVVAILGAARMTHHRTLRDLQPSLIG